MVFLNAVVQDGHHYPFSRVAEGPGCFGIQVLMRWRGLKRDARLLFSCQSAVSDTPGRTERVCACENTLNHPPKAFAPQKRLSQNQMCSIQTQAPQHKKKKGKSEVIHRHFKSNFDALPPTWAAGVPGCRLGTGRDAVQYIF